MFVKIILKINKNKMLTFYIAMLLLHAFEKTKMKVEAANTEISQENLSFA